MAIRPNFAPALLIGAFLALALPALAQEKSTETTPAEEQAKPELKVSSLFDVKAFVPGQMAHLVVVLDVPVDWHIYWANPGASGLATSVKVTGPEGWKIMAARFPGPTLHKGEGGEITYILEGKAAFFVPIIPPDNAQIGQEVEFEVQASWLMCKGLCRRGSFQSKVKAKVAGGLPVRNSDRFIAAMRSVLPRRGMGPSGIGISLTGNAKEGDLTFHSLDSREFEFFAYPDSPMVVVERNSLSQSAERSMHNFHLKPAYGKTPEGIEVHGVLRVKAKERTHFFEIQYKGVMNLAPKEIPAGHGNLPELPKKPAK